MTYDFIYANDFNIKEYVENAFRKIIYEYSFTIFQGMDIDVNGEYISDRYFVTLSNQKCSILIGFGLDSQYTNTRYFILQYFSPLKQYERFDSIDLTSFRLEPKDNLIVDNDLSELIKFKRFLENEAAHTYRYRKDILTGDFESWREIYNKNKFG